MAPKMKALDRTRLKPLQKIVLPAIMQVEKWLLFRGVKGKQRKGVMLRLVLFHK
jgi:hypothetical protein